MSFLLFSEYNCSAHIVTLSYFDPYIVTSAVRQTTDKIAEASDPVHHFITYKNVGPNRICSLKIYNFGFFCGY